jgi:hypothetical protein
MTQPTTNDMPDPPTCGQGLAHHSRLPARIGALTTAMADVLEHHMTSLDRSDANARREHDAYGRLVAQHRRLAADLQATSAEMASYRDLPMAPHDMDVLMAPDGRAIFERLVAAEEDLSALLESLLSEHRAMLGEMA